MSKGSCCLSPLCHDSAPAHASLPSVSPSLPRSQLSSCFQCSSCFQVPSQLPAFIQNLQCPSGISSDPIFVSNVLGRKLILVLRSRKNSSSPTPRRGVSSSLGSNHVPGIEKAAASDRCCKHSLGKETAIRHYARSEKEISGKTPKQRKEKQRRVKQVDRESARERGKLTAG